MTQSRHAKMMARFADNKKALEAVLKQQQAYPVRDMLFALQDRITELEAQKLQDRNAMDAIRTALEQQAEPVCPDCKAAVLYECVACSSNNYPPQQKAEPVAWMDREGDLYKMPEIENWAPPHTMLYTTPPQPLAQPISFAGLTLTAVRVPFGMTVRFEGGALIVETVHNVKEGKTPAFISCDAHGNIISKERNND